jgi:integrase
LNDIAVIQPEPSGALTTDEMGSVSHYMANAQAASTKRAYDNDMKSFRGWCDARGLCALPASPATVAAYLAHLADSGRRASGIGRAAAGITWHHREARVDPAPTAHLGVRRTLAGIRRQIGTAKQGKAPLTADLIGKMLNLAPDSVIGARDKALIALGFAGALRRSELVALQVSDLTEVPDGLRVLIRRSKTDQTGEGVELPVPRGSRLRPVDLVKHWLVVSGITSGPLFRPVALGGRIGDEALSPDAVGRTLKRYARRVGLDPAIYSGHSLRSGFLTSAAESGASLLRMADQSRHKSLEVLRGYVRRTDMWKDHPGGAFL